LLKANHDYYQKPSWTWSTFLLPYLEQQSLHDALGVDDEKFLNGSPLAPPTRETSTILSVYVCPSDSGPPLNDKRGGHAKSNYRSLMGNVDTRSGVFETLAESNGLFYELLAGRNDGERAGDY
jgi:hypothetical protein